MNYNASQGKIKRTKEKEGGWGVKGERRRPRGDQQKLNQGFNDKTKKQEMTSRQILTLNLAKINIIQIAKK